MTRFTEIVLRPKLTVSPNRQGPLLTAADASHGIAVLAVATMNALSLIGLTYRVMTNRFAVVWDTGAIAAVYGTAVGLVYLLRG